MGRLDMKVRLLGMALVAALGLSACDDNGPTELLTGRVRAVHLSPDAPAVDVLLDGSEVLSGVTYLGSSSYLDVPTGDRTFRVEPVGSNTAVIEATVPVAEDVDYTLLAVNTVANIEPLYLVDDNTAPAAGQARIRVLHGAPSVGPVDVYVTAPGAALGSPALTNVPFKGVSGYLAVPAGRYQVRVTPTGSTTVAINQEITAPVGVVATAIAVEDVGGGAPFSIAILVDNSN
jgi:hypothetical protein